MKQLRLPSLCLALALATACSPQAVVPAATGPKAKAPVVSGGGFKPLPKGLDQGQTEGLVFGRPVLDAQGQATGAVVQADGTVIGANGQPTGEKALPNGQVLNADGQVVGSVGAGQVQVPGGATEPPGGLASAPPGAPPASAPPGPTTAPASQAPVVLQHLPLESSLRPAEAGWRVVSLEGMASLLSNHGAGLIGNNSGGLIGNNSGGLLGNNGAGVVSNRTGQLLSNNAGNLLGNHGGGYRLAQSAAPVELPLAEAEVEFLDAQGRVLVDAQQQPLRATTDATGRYRYEGPLPSEAVVVRIRLYQGGQLQAMLAKDGNGSLSLNTATSLGAAYVVRDYVNSVAPGDRQGVYDRLPQTEATQLQATMELARAQLSQLPSYKPEESRELAAGLKQPGSAVDTRLEAIKAILLAGRSNLGNGALATEVGLSGPVAVAAGPGGVRWVMEMLGGRLRRIDAQGRIDAPDFNWPSSKPLTMEHLVAMPDGSLLVSDRFGCRVWRLRPDTKAVEVFAGTGQRGQSGAPGPATQALLHQPFALALGKDGEVYIGESPSGSVAGRILRVNPNGTMEALSLPTALASQSQLQWTGLAQLSDGHLAAFEEGRGQLWWRAPNAGTGGTWTQNPLPAGWAGAGQRGTLAASGTTLFYAAMGKHRVGSLSRGGTPSLLAGSADGSAGQLGDGGPAAQAQLNAPRGMAYLDGQLWIADAGNAVVRALPWPTAGNLQRVAGIYGAQDVGNASQITVNQAGGVCSDAQGNLLFSEGATGLIKKLEGGKVSTVGGQGLGFGGDGGPFAAATFSAPTGLALAPDGGLYLCDTGNKVVRRVSPEGTVSTLLGTPQQDGITSQQSVPAASLRLKRPQACVVGPDGALYVADSEANQVWKLVGSTATRVMGRGDGARGEPTEGLQASACGLSFPAGLCLGPEGSLYVADAANCAVWRVRPDGVVVKFAGLGSMASLLAMNSAGGAVAATATQQLMLAPAGLAMTADGRLLIAEAGGSFLAEKASLAAAIPIPKTGSRVWSVASDGSLRLIAGQGAPLLNQTGDQGISGVLALHVDPQGRLILADLMQGQLKLLPAGSF